MRWNSTIGMTSTSSSSTATAEDSGQSRLLKNSLHSVLPIISVSEPPSRSGMTNSPIAGMKTRKQPAILPGSDSGTVDRKSVGEGQSVSVRGDLGGRRNIKKKNNTQHTTTTLQ